MTAVLREAGLNRYPDIERVSDTLTIVDPRLSHIRAHLAEKRETEMATDNNERISIPPNARNWNADP